MACTERLEQAPETTVFLSYFKHPPDRRQLGKVAYPLEEILLLCLVAVLAGAESFVAIVRWAKRSAPSCAGPELSRGLRSIRIGSTRAILR